MVIISFLSDSDREGSDMNGDNRSYFLDFDSEGNYEVDVNQKYVVTTVKVI